MKSSGMKNIFFVCDDDKLFTIRIMNLDELPFLCPRGSYNVLKARLFGLEYAEFLRMARDNYSATLIGQTGYIVEKFKNKNDANKLCIELNKRINQILEEIRNENSEGT